MEFPEGIREQDRPVPAFLKVAYVLITAWCLFYLASSLRHHGVSAVTPVETQAAVR